SQSIQYMGKKEILIIDDSNTNLVLLESLLRKNGYIVHSALNAKEGIKTMQQSVPDLIYLDLVMPEVDGLKFIQMIRERDEWKDVPVVIISAVSDKKVIRQSIEMGVIDYITKPIDIEKIISLTNGIFEN
ncbi:MAG TPA: response regulator, partial [Bacteroidales bacterium]|nr:response regulator [Bacteroidales bacterium]